jgi:hypothetical protein
MSGPADLFSWFFDAIEDLSDAKKRHDLYQRNFRTVMRRPSCCKNIHMDPNVVMSVALSQYHFSTPEIR